MTGTLLPKRRRRPSAVGLEAGVDLQLYDFPHDVWQKAIAHLIESGSMKMSVLDTACRRVLRMKFALGLFENPYTDRKTRR